MAQWTETTVTECSLTSCVWARFRIGFHTMPGQRQSAYSDFVGSRMYACLGVTCHLHFWQNDRGLLLADAVTRGWNGHRIRVSTQSWLLRRKFSCRSCWDLNSQPFNHKSSALTNKQTQLPGILYGTDLIAKFVVFLSLWANQGFFSHPFVYHFAYHWHAWSQGGSLLLKICGWVGRILFWFGWFVG